LWQVAGWEWAASLSKPVHAHSHTTPAIPT
jgi:hypothetical protein